MKYTNYKCPVCGEVFNEDDDVVVCAECGTPHHRECYLQNGRCINENKHGTNEPIEVEFHRTEETENEEISEPVEAEIKTTPAENEAQKAVREIFEEINDSQREITIDGKHVSYYEAAIKKNQKYYIPRFMLIDRTKKGFSWNIAPFFVPLAWSLYRKMYKLATLILALYVLVFGSIYYSIFSNTEFTNALTACQEEDPYFAEDILAYYSNSESASLTKTQKELYDIMGKIKLPVPVTVFKYIIFYGVRMVMGIYATNLYYKKLTKYIEKVDKLDISPDMKRSVLYRKCGTLPIIIAVLIGLFEWQMF